MNSQAFMVIATISAVTMLLRLLPFVALEALRANAYLRYLGTVMPVGIMALLVGYSLKGTNFGSSPYGIPELAIAAGSAIMYWRTRLSLLSIGSGLVLYICLKSFVL